MTTIAVTPKIDENDLTSVLSALASKKVAKGAEAALKPSKVVQVSQGTKDAISRLNDDLESTQVPTTRRELGTEELINLFYLGYDAKAVDKAVKQAVSAVKEAVFNHFDVELEKDTPVKDLPISEDGKHYLVKQELEVGTTGFKFVRQLGQGAPKITAEDLKGLWDEGLITRAQYYRATRKPDLPRVVDEEGLLEILKVDRAKAAVASVLEPGTVTASFWIRPVSEEE